MAERRMYAKTIVLSDAFLDMPASARCLYFTLGMLADDDGFVNSPRSIMRQSGASDDDMKILIAKKFVLLFDSGVIVIKHWKIHNYIQNDRYKPTKYVKEKSQITCGKDGIYHKAEPLEIADDTLRIQSVSNLDTQVRLGKDRLDKVSIGEVSGSSKEDTPIEVQAAPTQESLPPTTTARISRECYSELVRKYGKQFVDTKAYRANNDEVLRKWCEEDAHNGRGAIRVNTNAAAAREKFRERERATADDLAYLKSVQDMVKGASV